MVKNLITTIQLIWCRLVMAQNSPELPSLNFLPLTYHHSHFLAATLDFTSFFTIAFLGATLFFLQLGCFGFDITSGAILTYLLFFITGRRKRFNHNRNQDLKQIFDFLILQLFLILSVIAQIIYIYLYHANYSLQDSLFAADLSVG